MAKTTDVLKHVCNIIRTEMDLAEEQVHIYQQKWTRPNDHRLWITVGIVTSKNFGSSRRIDDFGNQQQVSHQSALLGIDICGIDTEALDRKDQVGMALQSFYAQQLQEMHGFSLGRLPAAPLVNLSAIEGPAIPFRFNLTVQVQYAVDKARAVEYFDSFGTPKISTEA